MTQRISQQKLLQVLRYLGINRAELASHLGVSKSLINAIFIGKRGMRDEHVKKIEQLIEEQYTTGTNSARQCKEKN